MPSWRTFPRTAISYEADNAFSSYHAERGSECDSRSVFYTVGAVEIVGAHSQTDKHLAGLERRKVITDAYTLEAAANILNETCLLECIQTHCEIYR